MPLAVLVGIAGFQEKNQQRIRLLCNVPDQNATLVDRFQRAVSRADACFRFQDFGALYFCFLEGRGELVVMLLPLIHICPAVDPNRGTRLANVARLREGF